MYVALVAVEKVTEDSLAKKLAGLSVQGVSSAGPEEGERVSAPPYGVSKTNNLLLLLHFSS